MINWMQCEEAPWKTTVYGIVSRLPKGLVPWKAGKGTTSERQWHQAELASTMFYALGPGATNAIPKLLSISQHRTKADSQRALSAVASLGNAALPCLLTALATPGRTDRVAIAHLISGMRRDVRPAIPVLVSCMRDTNMYLVMEATRALVILKVGPEIVVPELISGLTNREHEVRALSAQLLMGFGAAAKPAVPSLVAALDDNDPSTCVAARGALRILAPEELEKDREMRAHRPTTVERRYK